MTKTFEYFNKPGQQHPDDRIELYCGDFKAAVRVHWDYLDDLLNRILEMSDAWDGRDERAQWVSWIHKVVLAATAQRTLVHRPVGFVPLPEAPDATKWMMYINPYVKEEKAQDDAEAS